MSAARPSANTRDARALRSAAALRSAFLKLLETTPLDQITVRGIAAEAGISYATFFRHHPTKEALLDTIAADQVEQLAALTLPAFEATDIHAAFVALCRYVEEHRQLWTTLLIGGAAATMREELLRLSRIVAAEHADPTNWLPVELSTTCSVGLIVEILSWWLRQPKGDWSSEEVATMLERLALQPMIAPPPE